MRRRALAALLALGMLTTACSGCTEAGDDARAEEQADASTTSTSAVPPDEGGPFVVGRRSITVTDPERDGRTLPVEVWYPVDPDVDTEGLAVTEYPFVGGVRQPSDLSFDDAPPADGPFPLVVFSHGNGGTRTQSVFLTEALASHGFVVASADHVGNTAVELITGSGVSQAQSLVDRPLDVSLLIDELSAWPQVDPDRVGVTGHSFGGLTTLATAADDGTGQPRDPRVTAIAPLAPASGVLSDEALASIEVPMLVVGGTLDATTPVDPQSVRPFELVASRDAFRVDVDGAGHISFTSICAPALAYVDQPDANPLISAYVGRLAAEGCGPDFTDAATVHRLTTRYVVAFFEVHLAGDEAFAPWLAPSDGASFWARR